jgi:hypothetical protein
MAAAGNPLRGDRPLWPIYDQSDTYLRLDRKRQCDFWDELIAMKPAR